MKHEHRFSKQQEHKQEQLSQHQVTEFASSDELLRHDAARTQVPPEIAVRLKASLAQIAAANAPKPWWKAWLGR